MRELGHTLDRDHAGALLVLIFAEWFEGGSNEGDVPI